MNNRQEIGRLEGTIVKMTSEQYFVYGNELENENQILVEDVYKANYR